MADTSPVLMIDPGGALVPVSPEDLADLQKVGYVPATSNQIDDYNKEQALKEKYENTGAQFATAVEGGLRGASLGLSDLVLASDEQAQEDIKQRKERNPLTAGGSELVGAALPVLATGGAGGTAKVATLGAKELIPSVAASTVGRMAEQATARAIGAEAATTLTGKALAKAASMGVGSAIEGAAYGAGNVVSEKALGDPNITAQSAATEIGLSALLGGALGGVMGAGEVFVPAAVTKAKDALGGVLSKAEGAAEKTLPGIWEKQGVSKEMSEFLLGPAKQRYLEFVEKFPVQAEALPKSTLETAAKVLTNFDQALVDPMVRKEMGTLAADSLQGIITETETAYRNALKNVLPKERETLITKHLGMADSAVEGEAARLAGQIENTAKALRANKDLYDQGYAAALENIHTGFAQRVSKKGITPGEIAEEVLATRKLIDEQIPYAKNAMAPFSERNALALVEPLRAEFKGALKNEGIWGKAGSRIAALNEAQHEYIKALDALLGKNSGAFDAKATKLVQRVGGLHGEIKVIPRRIETWLNQMADQRGGAMIEAVQNYREKARALIEQIEESYKTAPVGKFDPDGLKGLINKSGESLEQVRKSAGTAQILNDMERSVKGGSWGSGIVSGQELPINVGGTAQGIANAVVGHAVAGPAGSVASGLHTVYQTAKSVPKAVKTLAALERMANRVSHAIDVGTGALVRGSVRGSYIGRGELAAGIASRFNEKRYNASYEKRANEITRLANAPDILHDRLSKQADTISEHAPDTTQALQAHTARAVNFLASKLPQHPKTAPLQPDWKPSAAEVAKFERYHEAVDNPLVILKQASAGTLTPEAIEAVKVVHPDIYNQICAKVVEKVSQSKSIPYRSRIMASMLLGQDLDGTIKQIPATKAIFAGPSSKSPQDQAKPSKTGAEKLTLSNRTQTPTQALSKGGNDD